MNIKGPQLTQSTALGANSLAGESSLVRPTASTTCCGAATPPKLTVVAHEILSSVLDAMQRAEELGGPEDQDYVALMGAISAEAKARIANFKANRAEGCPIEDPGFSGSEARTFVNDCGERNGVPLENFLLFPGEGFNVVNCRGLNIGVVFQPNPLEETGHLAFMGSGLFCGEHSTQDSAIHAVQVAFFG